MAEKSTFIMLDRNITKWRWYKDGNTVRVFLHLLINANIQPCGFENITVERGQVITSYDSLDNALKLSKQQIRNSIAHLKSTETITVKRYSKFQLITITNYDYYQSKPTLTQHSHNTHSTFKQHQYNNINNLNNENNDNNKYIPSSEENFAFDFLKEDKI